MCEEDFKGILKVLTEGYASIAASKTYGLIQ